MATIIAAAAGGNWTTGATWIGGAAPTAADDAVLQLASGNVTINSGAVCRSIDCTSGIGDFAGTLTHSAAVTLTIGDATAGAGNVALKFSAGMTYTRGSTSTSICAFVSTSATVQTVSAASKNLSVPTFNGAGGSWQLGNSPGSISGALMLTLGTLDLNGQTIGFAGTTGVSSTGAGARSLICGAATLNFNATGTGNFWDVSSSLTLSAASATFVLNSASSSGRTFAGGGLTYGTLQYTVTNSSGTLTITGSNTFGTLSVSDGTAARNLRFASNSTTTVTTLSVSGASGAVISFLSNTAGIQATILQASGTPTNDWLAISDTFVSGGATWTPGANSTDGGNNTGWLFGGRRSRALTLSVGRM